MEKGGGEKAENGKTQGTREDISRRQEENTFYLILFLIY